ncbi:MAG: O-antigen ligase family protein [Bacteroidota bacterium]
MNNPTPTASEFTLPVNQTGDALLSDVQTGQVMKWLGISLRLLLGCLLISIVAVQILIVVCAFLWCLLLWKGVKYKPTILDLPILIYLACRVLSILFSTHISLSIIAINRELLFYVTYFIMAFYIGNTKEEELFSLFRWLFYPTAIVTVYAIADVLLGSIYREHGLSGGGTISLHLCFSFIILLIYKDRPGLLKSSYHWWGLFIIFIAGIIVSLTRGEWISATVVTIIYGWLYNKKALFGILLIAVIAASTIPLVRERVLTFSSPLENTSDRLTLWKNALSHSGDHPILGFGPETFLVVFNDWQTMGDRHVGSWHNDFIHLYMESGIVGVLGWLGVLGTFSFVSLKVLRYGKDVSRRIGWMGILLIIAYLITGCFSIPTFSITNAILFRFLLVIVVVEYSKIKTAPTST